MAYITNAIYNKLIKSRSIHNVEVPEKLYEELDYHFGIGQVLSEYELGILGEHIRISSKMNGQENEKPYLPPKRDKFLYVFENESPYKYHLFDDCIYLNNNFMNYVVPEEIRFRGTELVIQYRDWFVGHGFDKILGDDKEKISKITFRYNTSFAPLHNLPILYENEKLIANIKNSTYEISKKYYNLINVQNKVREYVRKYKIQFNNRTILNLMIYSHYVNFSKKVIEQKITELTSDVFLENYGFEKLINEFRDANRIKYVIMEELKLYINFRCGFKSNNFSEEVLESYGLVCCKACLERFNRQV